MVWLLDEPVQRSSCVRVQGRSWFCLQDPEALDGPVQGNENMVLSQICWCFLLLSFLMKMRWSVLMSIIIVVSQQGCSDRCPPLRDLCGPHADVFDPGLCVCCCDSGWLLKCVHLVLCCNITDTRFHNNRVCCVHNCPNGRQHVV